MGGLGVIEGKMIRVLRLVLLLILSPVAAVTGDDLDKAVLPPNPTEAQIRSYLRTIQHFLENNYERENPMLGTVRVRMPEREVLRRLDAKFAAVPTGRLDVMLSAISKSGSPVFEQLAADAVITADRSGFLPEHRDLLHKHLALAPKLIVVIDRLDWLDTAHPGFRKAWKQAKQTRVSGMLDDIGFRLASISARSGWLDAVVTIAGSAKKRATLTDDPEHAGRLRAEREVLESLVPGHGDGENLVGFILGNEDRLGFDARASVYRLHP